MALKKQKQLCYNVKLYIQTKYKFHALLNLPAEP